MGENCVAKSLQKIQFLHAKKLSEKKMVKTKVADNFKYQAEIYFILTKSEKCGFESQKCLANIGRSHFLTKMVFLQSSSFTNFFAQEN